MFLAFWPQNVDYEHSVFGHSMFISFSVTNFFICFSLIISFFNLKMNTQLPLKVLIALSNSSLKFDELSFNLSVRLNLFKVECLFKAKPFCIFNQMKIVIYLYILLLNHLVIRLCNNSFWSQIYYFDLLALNMNLWGFLENFLKQLWINIYENCSKILD